MKETKNTRICSECGKEVHDGYWEEFDGKVFCRDCLSELTVVCQDCGERMYRGANVGTSSHPLCDSCQERSYTYCEQCGRLLRNEDAYYFDDDDDDCPYCQSCFERTNRRAIKDYYYKPDPIFYGESDRFFGVELEIDGAGEDSVYAEDVLAVGNKNAERIYCKHDGSLSDGFEIVTHPMSLGYHVNQMPWRAVVKTARNLGYTSHQAETCGLHVHVNRDSLGSTSEEQDATIGRILYFVEKNWNELLVFSRRTEYQLSRWAARYGYKDQPKEMLEHAKKGYLSDDMDAELIADGCHLPPSLLRLAHKLKGADHLALITDGMRAAGSDVCGPCDIGGVPCIIEDGVAKLCDRSAFAGSIATADRLLRTVVSAGIPLTDGVKMLTKTPARIMGLSKKGELKIGYDADLVIFDDDIRIKAVFLQGERIS